MTMISLLSVTMGLEAAQSSSVSTSSYVFPLILLISPVDLFVPLEEMHPSTTTVVSFLPLDVVPISATTVVSFVLFSIAPSSPMTVTSSLPLDTVSVSAKMLHGVGESLLVGQQMVTMVTGVEVLGFTADLLYLQVFSENKKNKFM